MTTKSARAPKVNRQTIDTVERGVRRRAFDVPDARELFEMLGLVEHDGRELVYPPEDPWDGGTRPAPDDGVVLHELPPRRQSTAPEALRMLAPPVLRAAPPAATPSPRERAPRAPRPRLAAPKPPRAVPCGTPAGYKAHHRRGEPTCQPCRDAENARSKAYKASIASGQQRVQRFRQRPPCGTHGGYYVHRRAGEDACRPCKDAVNEYMKVTKAQRHTTRESA